MQNYSQQQGQGYQRPASTASFAGQFGPPPPYGGQQGHQTAAPQAQSQWAPPVQSPPQAQQWNQPRQAASGYNPGVYGPMPGVYTQGQQPLHQASAAHALQQEDVPPPPPPKPAGFNTAPVWEPSANPSQQPHHNYQEQHQSAGGAQQVSQSQHGGLPQHAMPQQSYNNNAPPPPSQTPGGSYFPPARSPVDHRGPYMYGTGQVGQPSAVSQQTPSSVPAPNEQNSTYIPPSLSGQGVQAYMPANTNPIPGVYVPPPPDVPAWQQAQHAPLQGGKKFKYTKPTVDPSFFAQGYQGVQPVQQQGQFEHASLPQQNQTQLQQPGYAQYQSPGQTYVQGQLNQGGQAFITQGYENQYGQFSQASYMQQNQPGLAAQTQQNHYEQQQQQQPQWQPTPPIAHTYPQQPPIAHTYPQQPPNPQTAFSTQHHPQVQGWQPEHEAHNLPAGQQQFQGQHQDLQTPKPLGRVGTAPPEFVNQPSPQSQPVSPLQKRQSISSIAGQSQTGIGRTASVSSIALGAIHAQRVGHKVEPSKPPPKLPIPPPPRDDATKFSVLSSGGPSDWEHFGGADEIDDEELFAKKEPALLDSTEIQAPAPSPPCGSGEWPSPADTPAVLGVQRSDTFQPTPPPTHIATLAHDLTSQLPTSSHQTPQRSTAAQENVPPFSQPQRVPAPEELARPAQEALQSSSVSDAVAKATPYHLGPSHLPVHQPNQSSFTPQTFVMDDGSWVSPQQVMSVPVQSYHQQPLPDQRGFIPEGGRHATHVQETSPNQSPHLVSVSSGQSLLTDLGPKGTEPSTSRQQQQSPAPEQAASSSQAKPQALQQGIPQAISDRGAQLNQAHMDESKLRNEVHERLTANAERDKADLLSKIANLNNELERSSKHFESEKHALDEQLSELQTAAREANATIEKLNRDMKEKDSTIERLQEDAEGKDEANHEKESKITDLAEQLKAKDSAIHALEERLQVQVSKGSFQSIATNLIPDVDPWYVTSLERYVAMLRSEAHVPAVVDKVKIFTSFLKAESSIRNLEYYNAPLLTSAKPDPASSIKAEGSLHSRDASSSSSRKQELSVQMSSERVEEDYDYSPGGRPMLKQKSKAKPEDNSFTQQSFSTTEPSGQHTAVLTPTSSLDDDFGRTPNPVQSPPEEQPQYKAYVPPAVTQSDSTKSLHRQSMVFSNIPVAATLQPSVSSSSEMNDETFFDSQSPEKPKKASVPPPIAETSKPDADTPAPLFTSKRAPAKLSTPTSAPATARTSDLKPEEKHSAFANLVDLVPQHVNAPMRSKQLMEVEQKVSKIEFNLSFFQDLSVNFDKTAVALRKKNEDARRKRQAASEDHANDLYENKEITYNDIAAIEEEFNVKEHSLKAQEDRDEYKSYVEAVFDKMYDELHEQIKSLMSLYREAENLMHLSTSSVETLTAGATASTEDSLRLLKRLHDEIEMRHEKVALAVAERDKRYKKTEIAPLYAAGNIAKMKTVEKHFENAEKQAVARAKHEKSERMGDLVHLAEDAVFGAVGVQQGEIDAILAAIRNFPEKSDADLLDRAQNTLSVLKSSSKDLLSLFNALEIDLNTAVVDADIAHACAENAGSDRLQQLDQELALREKKLKDELRRRIGVIDQDEEEIEKLIADKGGPLKLSDEDEKKERMRKALEEAKRRNGDL